MRHKSCAMAQTTAPDVYIEGEFFPALRRVRVLYISETLELLDAGRGRLAGRFGYVTAAHKHSFRLPRGRGVQLFVQRQPPYQLWCPWEASPVAEVHAVVLYRGMDGEYCFFDSDFDTVPTPEVVEAAQRSGGAVIHYRYENPGIQGVGLRTCQNFCLAFMSFVVQHPGLPTGSLIREFVAWIRPRRDEEAVLVTQELFDEAGIVKDLEGSGLPVQDYLPAPARLRERRHARTRPVQRRRVVSKFLRRLTRQQVRTLLRNVRVSVPRPRQDTIAGNLVRRVTCPPGHNYGPRHAAMTDISITCNEGKLGFSYPQTGALTTVSESFGCLVRGGSGRGIATGETLPALMDDIYGPRISTG